MTPTLEAIAREAHALGFSVVGSAPLQPSPRADYVRAWMANRAAEMTWLTRTAATRIDPTRRYTWARSAIMVAWPYPPPPPAPVDWRATLTGRIAGYALGRDYHELVRGRLGTLVQKLGRVLPGARFHRYVDTGPLIERELATAAGLGWTGKNTLVLQRTGGSWFLIGTVLTSAELPVVAPSADHCGTCTRCVSACPTAALEAGYTMDPQRCISYLTIEHRSALPMALRGAIENWVFGCDVCQEVCPWNAPPVSTAVTAWLQPSLVELLALDDRAFRRRFHGTAVLRATRRGMVRNAAVALGNSGNPEAVAPLCDALADPDALVREHVAWALGRLGGAAARSALTDQRGREEDATVLATLDQALATL